MPSAQEHLETLLGFYKDCPMLKDLPCLPVPKGYIKHEAMLAMLGTETIAPFVAVRSLAGVKDAVNSGLTREETIQLARDPRIDCWTASCASYALSNNAPVIHIAADLAQAFADTDPSSEPSDYRMPFPSFILSLPCGLVKNSDDGSFDFILVSSVLDMQAWWHSNGLGFAHWGLSNPESKDFYLCGYSLASGVQYIAVQWHEISKICQGALDDGGDHRWEAPALSDQCNFSTLCRIACNAILAINHSPELFYEEPTEIKRNPGFGKNSTYQGSIRWLGKTYQRSTDPYEQSPSGRNNRPHWRRGHWHTVLHGAKRALKKLQWFQPVYVNKTDQG